MNFRHVCLIVFLSSFVVFNNAVRAADPCADLQKEINGLSTLQKLVNQKCLGEENDQDKVATELRKQLQGKPGIEITPKQRVETVRAVLLYLRKTLEEKSKLQELQLPRLPLPANEVSNPIAIVNAELARAASKIEGGMDVPELTKEHWSLDMDEGKLGNLYDFKKTLFLRLCGSPVSNDCPTPVMAVAKETVRYAHLMQWLSQYSEMDALKQFSAELNIFDEQWRLYSTETRSQTPIELAVNSEIFERRLDKNGFVAPPDYQYIVLHPSAALEYVSGAADGSRFKPAIIMEWIGYNTWSWRTKGGVRMVRPIGVSLASSFTDRAGSEGTGHGLLFHYNHVYSLGITRHGDDTGVFLSVDLQNLLGDKKAQLKDVKAKFKIGMGE